MTRRSTVLTLALVGGLTSGCVNPRSFVDPSFPTGSYESVERLGQPLQLRVAVAFERNGSAFPRADPELRDITERTLRGSGVILPSSNGDGEIRVVVNNFVDASSAVAQGVGTGLTFGLVGSTVTDAYEMSMTVTYQGRTVRRTGMKQALRTAIGNTSLPPGVQATTTSVAFARVVESMLLRTLADMQRSGELSRSTPARPPTS